MLLARLQHRGLKARPSAPHGYLVADVAEVFPGYRDLSSDRQIMYERQGGGRDCGHGCGLV